MSASLAVSEIKRGLDFMFRETFESVHGIFLDRDTSLFETLATISAEEASHPVSATCATLAAQVEHIRFYLDTLEGYMLKTLEGRVDWAHIWNTVSAVTPEEWEASKARLRASYERVSRRFQEMETLQGEDDLGTAMAMIAHTAYHLGEIRQALCTLKS
ncbi:MAG: hypothetical protein L6Q98_01415 [Anaerolineae bacterium]|nr:hypothetical protein [Anaerolineae bacterium]NUQ04429.1 hypothetical protein [Anaerolineae bacterium]